MEPDRDRPFVVVSVGTSVDGRVTLRRSSLLMDPDAGKVWAAMSPASSKALHQAREAEINALYQLLGVTCVVSKAGGGLNGALLRHGLIDELHLIVAPALVGGRDTPTVFDGPELASGQTPTKLRLLSAGVEADGMLWLRYDVSPTQPTASSIATGIRL